MLLQSVLMSLAMSISMDAGCTQPAQGPMTAPGEETKELVAITVNDNGTVTFHFSDDTQFTQANVDPALYRHMMQRCLSENGWSW